LLGASVTGEPTAARSGDYLLNTTAILLDSLILIGGFVALSARLWEAGQRLLPALIPFMVFLLPYFLGAALLRHGGAEITHHNDSV
jgi:hypothetical protein